MNNRAGCKDSWKDPQTKGTVIDPPHQYYVFADVFKQEVCAGCDSNAIAKALADRGHLVTAEKGRYSYKKTISGMGRARVYHILPSLFDEKETDEAPETLKEYSRTSCRMG